MTDPERPATPPAAAKGPTPEEISARLEALLKRTHALRVEQAASPNPLGMTWPPPNRELAHVDVVDVPEDESAHATSTPAAPVAPAAALPATARDSAPVVPVAAESPVFDRPDWSELRLRTAQDDQQPSRRGLLLLTLLLAAATLAQAAYIISSRSGASASAQLRVDGPAGAEVRVDGRSIGAAPIDQALPPGDYDVEIVQGAGAVVAQRVTLGEGRTLLLVPSAAARPAPSPTGTPITPAGAGGSTPAPVTPAAAAAPVTRPAAGTPANAPAGSPPPAAAAGAVSATRGAVLIESTPAGLPVTMEGRERGVTPITIGQLRPGRHDVLVGGLAQKVDVAANTVSTLRVTRR